MIQYFVQIVQNGVEMRGQDMLRNNVEVDVKVKCIEENLTQTKLAEDIGTSAPYVSRLIRNNEKIVNKTFLQIMERLGYDVELRYVKRGK